MKLPFLSNSKSLDPKLSSSPPWPFPACANIKTLSFRASTADTDAFHFRTFNSVFVETEITPDSSRSFSTLSEDSGDPVESGIRGLRSERLFFEPQQSSSLVSMTVAEREEKGSSAMEEKENEDPQKVGYKESEILPMDSDNPYEDFRRSMEEMVEAHGLKDWEGLEELLGCYLKINGKNNHGYIMGAFIDLLVSLSLASSTSTSSSSIHTSTSSSSSLSFANSNYSSPSSPLSLPSSSLTLSCLSSILDHDEDDDEDDGHNDDGKHHTDDDHVPS